MTEKTNQIVRIKEICRSCSRVNSRSSRQQIYFRCKYCGTLNAGRKLLEEGFQNPPKTRTRKTVSDLGDSVATQPVEPESGAKTESPTPKKEKNLFDKLFGKE